MTNYEKIKNMSVEEMAEAFAEITDYCWDKDCSHCPCGKKNRYCGFGKWLESKAKEEA